MKYILIKLFFVNRYRKDDGDFAPKSAIAKAAMTMNPFKG